MQNFHNLIAIDIQHSFGWFYSGKTIKTWKIIFQYKNPVESQAFERNHFYDVSNLKQFIFQTVKID